MRMEDRVINDVLVITPLDQRIDASAATEFKGIMVDWINKGYARIVLDLVNVDFIDSSGLGAIISSLKSLGQGGDLALCNISKPVMNLFHLTRMHRVFKLFDSQDKAVAYLLG